MKLFPFTKLLKKCSIFFITRTYHNFFVAQKKEKQQGQMLNDGEMYKEK